MADLLVGHAADSGKSDAPGSTLRGSIEPYVDAGVSKFVVRRLAPVAFWAEGAAWLAETILDLHTGRGNWTFAGSCRSARGPHHACSRALIGASIQALTHS